MKLQHAVCLKERDAFEKSVKYLQCYDALLYPWCFVILLFVKIECELCSIIYLCIFVLVVYVLLLSVCYLSAIKKKKRERERETRKLFTCLGACVRVTGAPRGSTQ